MNKKIIHAVFEKISEEFSNNTAIQEQTRSISYNDLNSDANRLSYLLKDIGITTGDVVGVLMPSSINTVVSLLATFKVGAIYLPLDFSFSPKRFKEIFSKCQPKVIITNALLFPDLESLVRELDLEIDCILTYDNDCKLYQSFSSTPVNISITEYSTANPKIAMHPDDGNYIVYTSGSTGNGKAILGCHKSLSHFIHWEIKEFKFDASIRVAQLSQITFDASFRDVFIPLCTGGTLFIPGQEIKNNPGKLIEWIEQYKVQLIHCVPSLFKLLTKEFELIGGSSARLQNLRYILMAGEALYPKDIIAWRTVIGEHVELVNLYGTSESTLAKTFHRIGEVPEDTTTCIHVGKPIDNTIVAIIHDGIPCKPGEIGDVYIKTPFYTKGYFKDEKLTQKIFVPHPLTNDVNDIFHKTGDLGRYQEDGNIEILGRIDDQVKINGIRIELGEIKQAVLGIDEIQEAEIIVNNENGSNELICYYVGNISIEKLRTDLRTELNDNILPSYFIQLEEFPLNINGKVDKRSLPKPREIVFRSKAYEAPVTETETKIERIWHEVLALEKIGRSISFFKIGGTSLKAMQVISRLYREFEVNIQLSDFFQHSTIAEQASLISGQERFGYEGIDVIPHHEYYDITQIQQDIWVMDHFIGAKNLYNMVNAYEIEGPLDIKTFEIAFAQVVNRHEILRTTFINVDEILKQRVNQEINVSSFIEHINLKNEDGKKTLVDEYINGEVVNGFDLEKGPLLRIKLIQLELQKYIYLITLHHIISDGWSLEILNRDFLTFYSSLSQSGNQPEPLKIQYKDYASWLNKKLCNESLKDLEKYWVSKLDEHSSVEFPTDFDRPGHLSLKGDVIKFDLDENLSTELRAIKDRNGTTLFVLFNALINIVLSKYTGKKDIITGSPFSGRTHEDLEDQIGIFVNVVVLRLILDEKDTFKSVLQKSKDDVLSAYKHQLYPFNFLVSSLNIERHQNKFPLVNILLQSQTFEIIDEQIQIKNINISPYKINHLTSKVDLTFNFTESDKQISIIMEYRTDLFKTSTIRHLFDNICYISREIIENNEISIFKIRLLSTPEDEEEANEFKKLLHL